MQSGVKIDIKVQSFSDVITNSSSEVFCTITGNTINDIYELLITLFKPYDFMDDITPGISFKEEDSTIEVSLPYEHYSIVEFYKAGLEAILDKHFEKSYEIVYES